MTICRYEERWNTVQYWWNLIDLLGNVGTCWEMLGNSKLHSQHLKMLLFDANSMFYPVGWVAATMAFCRPRTPAPQKSRSPKRSESALPVITYHITGWQSPCLGLTYRRINNKSWRRKTMKDLWILWKSESLDIPAGLLDDSSRHSEHPRFCTHTVLRWTKSALIHTATCHNLSQLVYILASLGRSLQFLVKCRLQRSGQYIPSLGHRSTTWNSRATQTEHGAVHSWHLRPRQLVDLAEKQQTTGKRSVKVSLPFLQMTKLPSWPVALSKCPHVSVSLNHSRLQLCFNVLLMSTQSTQSTV